MEIRRAQARESISTEMITMSFLVCGISNTINGSKDNWDFEDKYDEANEGTCEDDGDVDGLNSFSDSDD